MASRKEEKERRRQERLERERALQAQERRRRRYAVVVGSTLVVAALIAVGVVIAAGGGGSDGNGDISTEAKNTLEPPPQRNSNLFEAAKAADCVLKNPPIQGRQHLLPTQKTPKYSTDPPTSGNHDPIPTPDGVYTTQPGARHFVHTLEHGRVEIQYSPSLDRRRVRQLGGLFNESPHDLLLFPNNTMPFRVAATAWGHLAGCKKVTNRTFDVIRAFRDRYLDSGPEPPTSQPSNF